MRFHPPQTVRMTACVFHRSLSRLTFINRRSVRLSHSTSSGGVFIMRRMIDQGTSNSFATSALDVVATRDTAPFSEGGWPPIRALILAYLFSPAAKMRKQADAQVALCPTFVDIFADLTQSAIRTASSKLPPSEFNRSEVTNFPASFAALVAALSASISPGTILPETEISTLSSLRLED